MIQVFKEFLWFSQSTLTSAAFKLGINSLVNVFSQPIMGFDSTFLELESTWTKRSWPPSEIRPLSYKHQVYSRSGYACIQMWFCVEAKCSCVELERGVITRNYSSETEVRLHSGYAKVRARGGSEGVLTRGREYFQHTDEYSCLPLLPQTPTGFFFCHFTARVNFVIKCLVSAGQISLAHSVQVDLCSRHWRCTEVWLRRGAKSLDLKDVKWNLPSFGLHQILQL